jgi:hypothetical protein
MWGQALGLRAATESVVKTRKRSASPASHAPSPRSSRRTTRSQSKRSARAVAEALQTAVYDGKGTLRTTAVVAQEASHATRDAALALVEANMAELYSHSSWGWNRDRKRDELNGHDMTWLLLADHDGAIRAMTCVGLAEEPTARGDRIRPVIYW